MAGPVAKSLEQVGRPITGVGGVAGAAALEEPRTGTLARWIASVSSMSLGLSLLLHTMIVVILAVATVSIVRMDDSGGASPIELDVSITEPTALTGVTNAQLDVTTPSADAQVGEVSTPGVLEGPGGDDKPAQGAGLGQIAEGLGGAGGGSIAEGLGAGGGAGGGGAKFFGVEARGSRFVYICDISGSMNYDARGTPNGKKLLTLKIELAESIKALLEHMQFFVIFFSSDAEPMQEGRKWITALPPGKKFALDIVNRQTAFGGTEPWPAFDIALSMRPLPDAIYFMTDGEFDISVAEQVRQVNGRTASGAASRRVPIHCISLVSREGEEVLRKIAAESGGTYLHVEGTR